MIYSIRELIAKLEDLKEQGFRSLSFLELLETIGWEKEDLVEVLKIYDMFE